MAGGLSDKLRGMLNKAPTDGGRKPDQVAERALEANQKIAKGLRDENARILLEGVSTKAERDKFLQERDKLQTDIANLTDEKDKLEIAVANLRREAEGKYGPEAVKQVADMTAKVTRLEQDIADAKDKLAAAIKDTGEARAETSDYREGFVKFAAAIADEGVSRPEVGKLAQKIVARIGNLAGAPGTEPHVKMDGFHLTLEPRRIIVITLRQRHGFRDRDFRPRIGIR